jgi:hypothetical protein
VYRAHSSHRITQHFFYRSQNYTDNIVQTKHDFLDSLFQHQGVLDCIPLPESSVHSAQARKDILRENIVLNGVQFSGEAKAESFFAALSAIAESANLDTEQAEAVTERILCSISRTSCGADAFFMLNELLRAHVDELKAIKAGPGGSRNKDGGGGGGGDLGSDAGNSAGENALNKIMLKPRAGPLHPVQIDLVRRGNHHLRATVSITNLFGLYHEEDITDYVHRCSNSSRQGEIQPWILLDTVVAENLR